MADQCRLWNKIPLSDYESHMAHEQVGQHQLQNKLLEKYLGIVKPSVFLYAGISGGNGLEHINHAITKEVVGVDVNPEFLEITRQRYGKNIPGLILHCLDIREENSEVCKADLAWASLVIEYTGIPAFIRFCRQNIGKGGHVVITIQEDHGCHSVTDTGIESMKSLEKCFRTIDTATLVAEMQGNGFTLNGKEENFLPGGKSLRSFHFIYDR